MSYNYYMRYKNETWKKCRLGDCLLVIGYDDKRDKKIIESELRLGKIFNTCLRDFKAVFKKQKAAL